MRIAVATQTFGSGFTGLMYAQIRKHLPPGTEVTECAIVLRDDPGFVRSRLLRLLEDEQRPGALIGICIRPDAETVAAFRAAGAPVVLIDEEQDGASTVSSDNFAGGYLAGQHLAQSGRRAIRVICGQRRANGGYNALQRVNGVAKALAERGIPFSADRDVLEVVDYSRRDGVAGLAALLQAGREVDGVFCAAGDVCATGVLATARERRLRVPDQLAVVGYDDNPVASLSNPPLSTVRQPVELIAGEAARLATAAAAEVLERPKRLLLQPSLVARQSA